MHFIAKYAKIKTIEIFLLGMKFKLFFINIFLLLHISIIHLSDVSLLKNKKIILPSLFIGTFFVAGLLYRYTKKPKIQESFYFWKGSSEGEKKCQELLNNLNLIGNRDLFLRDIGCSVAKNMSDVIQKKIYEKNINSIFCKSKEDYFNERLIKN